MLTIKEVCEEILKELSPKPNVLVGMKQSTFSMTIRQIYIGKAKPCTVAAFLNKFGYEGAYNEWQKARDITGKKQPANMLDLPADLNMVNLADQEKRLIEKYLATDNIRAKGLIITELKELNFRILQSESALMIKRRSMAFAVAV